MKITKVTFKVEPVGPDLYGTERFSMYVAGDAEGLREVLEEALAAGASEELVELEPAMLFGSKLMVPARLFLAVESVEG